MTGGGTPSGTGSAARRRWAMQGLGRLLRGLPVWICLPVLAVPVVFGHDRIAPSLRSLAMDRQGAIRVEAEQTRIETRDAAFAPTCIYHYRFRTPDGAEVTGSDRREGPGSECLRRQPRFAVQYPPGAPQDSRIDHLSLDGWVEFLGWMAAMLVMALAGIGALWWREARVARVLDQGVAGQGTVTGLLTVQARGGTVRYLQWRDAQGQPGRSLYPLGSGRVPEAGETIPLLRDPATGRSYWRDEL